ncbi:MAG: hypothetical protein DMG99_17125, partial [Acidobacteria bacterium]
MYGRARTQREIMPVAVRCRALQEDSKKQRGRVYNCARLSSQLPAIDMPKAMLAPDVRKKLEAAAAKVMKNAHAPYSNFHVGSAVLLANGKIYTGCNVEN